ncbi:MAG: hypothetical protein VX341_13645 [Bdellovibrionota bacterium]|nr:hypothetical protein [Bdellovibrionota bacterium]
MKKIMIGMAFLLTLNSYALECVSNEDPNKKLFLNTKGMFQEAIIVTNKIVSILVGKKTDYLGSSYVLFNESGEKVKLNISYNRLSHHCRARLCPSNGDDLLKPESIGKLEIGEEVEYFDCL